MGLRKYKRSIAKNNIDKLLFDMNCYTTLPGSLAICNYAFLDKDERPDIKQINSKMNELMKNSKELISFEDPKYIDKTLKYFGMKRASNLSIALVVGKYNTLFSFYDGEKVLPLREDGVMTRTLLDKDSKIIPITFE